MRALIVAAALAVLGSAPVAAAEPAAALNAEVTRLAKPADGVVGVAAWRLDGRGPRMLVNADQPFPMASTFKVAVAGTILSRVDRGEVRLDQLVPVPQAMMVESEGLAETFHHAGGSAP